jgi:hypothetical protein
MKTRKERELRTNLKRVGVGIFLVLFALSIVGGLALITLSAH